MKGRKNTDYFDFRGFWGIFCRVEPCLPHSVFLRNISHPYDKSAVITTSRYSAPNHCHHKAMVIVYNVPKRSGQVYDDWTMM
jgi:hypothetical protein